MMQQEEEKKESSGELLLSLDPGFVRVGVCVIDVKSLKIVLHENRQFVLK